MSTLQGKIALVTGASRGAGRGIAIELAKAGATVYLTGRSTTNNRSPQFPRTIDDTVAAIEDEGGVAYALRCDHTNDTETKSVIERIEAEQGKLDILVNNVWGGNQLGIENKPFWESPLEHWETMFQAGVRAQLVTNYYALPLLRKHAGGLIVHTTFWDDHKYIGHFYYDLAKNALNRMAYGLAQELKAEQITVLAVSPGWMRTELVLAEFKTDEEHWQDIKELANTETPHYVGRAICALASDPSVHQKAGQILRVGELAAEYNFTDLDGRRVPPFYL